MLPDYHSFSNRGGYAFPLHDRRPEISGSNISAALIDGLTAIYGAVVTPEQVFDAILCLLSARSYTQRFAEDLEDVFPHVPFPADHSVFDRAAQLGERIRAIQTFTRAPERLADPNFARLTVAPSQGSVLKAADPDGMGLTLCEDGSGQITGLPAQLWDFEVSGFPVLKRWLEGRDGLSFDLALFDAFRDVCARIAELLDLFELADNLLSEALNAPLTREFLGLTES